MSDFMDSEAEVSDDELDNGIKGEDDAEEEEDDAEEDEEEVNDIIDDNPIEEDEDEDDDDDSDIGEGPAKRAKLESDDDDDVDDDDLDLIAENTGIKLKKKKHSRVKLLDSDDEEGEDEPENARDQIAHDIFDKEENDEREDSVTRPSSRQSAAAEYTAVENVEEEGSDEGDEIDDFIVDDDGAPSSKKKLKKKRSSYDDTALQEAQDIFGLEFDLSELDAEIDEDEDEDLDEDMDEEEMMELMEQRKAKKKAKKKKITEIFEPSELERGFMTMKDNQIKVTDIPERFQLRAVPVKTAEEAELLEEAEWIFQQAFMRPPISQQTFQDPSDPERPVLGFEPKPVTAIPRIKAALSFMRKEMFEVPFIAMYRKEYVEPELKKDDLWKVYNWDEKWTQFLLRKGNMKRLFEDMQTYQFEYTRQNPDMPLDEGFRLLEQEDIERLENAQNLEELMDVYHHFQLYYGNDIPAMQLWKESRKTTVKKTKKKTIRVKKIKPKKVVQEEKQVTPSSENQENKVDSENIHGTGDTEVKIEPGVTIDGKEGKEDDGKIDIPIQNGNGDFNMKNGDNTEHVDMEMDDNDISDLIDKPDDEEKDPKSSVTSNGEKEKEKEDENVVINGEGNEDNAADKEGNANSENAAGDEQSTNNLEKESDKVDGDSEKEADKISENNPDKDLDKEGENNLAKEVDKIIENDPDKELDKEGENNLTKEADSEENEHPEKEVGNAEPSVDPETGEIVPVSTASPTSETVGNENNYSEADITVKKEVTTPDAGTDITKEAAADPDGSVSKVIENGIEGSNENPDGKSVSGGAVEEVDFNKGLNINSESDEESEYEEQEIEVTDSEADEEDLEEKKPKLPKRRDLYSICKDNGLQRMASQFGLTAEQFGENVRDNYQRHDPEQCHQAPLEVAVDFICNTFPSAEAVLNGARHMLAVEISRDPLVKQTVRQVFYERAKIHITPTKRGKKEIDDFDETAAFMYLKNKPVGDLHGEQFLKMCIAEDEGYVKIRIGIDMDGSNQGFAYLDEVFMLFHRDEYSNLAQEWNKQRAETLGIALNKMLYPTFAKELKTKLLNEAKEYAIQVCKLKLRNWISVTPYQPDSAYNEDGEFGVENESNYCRVLGCSFDSDKNSATFFAMIDTDGQVVDFLRLKYVKYFRVKNEGDREKKNKDLEKLKDFIKKHQPQVIAIAAENRDATTVFTEITQAVNELEAEQQMGRVYVELVDGEIARIYQDSPRGQNEFRDYPLLLRHAVSIARRLQEPLVEFAGLTDGENELDCVRLHPLQGHLPKDELHKMMDIEFINQVNEVGVDINRCLEFPHRQILTHYICGLGPRKAALLLKTLRSQGSRLENRSQLVTVCEMGLQVFLNCAGFIRIEPSEANNDKYEVLDGTRIHPETYDWPRKMAIDALEYDDGMDDSNPSSAVEEILEQPDRLKDLDLDAFAEELARQGYGNRQITLYDIRDELIDRFKDHRPLYTGLSAEEKFRLLTGETPETLHFGKMVTCNAVQYAYKRPSREELDSANPTRNDDTNLWKCPFCLQDQFADLSEVWTHFDNGSCRGKAIGVKTRMSNGISGFIATRNISDRRVERPEERVKLGLTLYARVIKINYERMAVDLTCRSSDLADKQKKFCRQKDLYFDHDSWDRDRKREEAIKAVESKKTAYLKRVISHPYFRNVTFKDAEKALETMEPGECIVRPSSKGSDHLTATWKVAKSIYQHIDIKEDHKQNDFSIGKSLWIENEEYEDLDEILTRHITPLAAHAKEITTHKYFKETDGTRQKLEEILAQEKRKNPGRIPYFFTTSKQYPGKAMLGYMPRTSPRVEFVTITIDGFRYRGRIHASIDNLLKWFKEHFRDPVPGVGTPASVRRTPYGQTPYGQTPMSMMGSAPSTPYTPGSTPSDLISNDEAAKLMQQAFPPGFAYNNGFAMTPGTTPSRSTPGYSTPNFSTPGGFTPKMDIVQESQDNDKDQTFTPTGKNYTPSEFTPINSNFNTPDSNKFPPVGGNFTPMQNNFVPIPGNFTPIQGNYTPVDTMYTPVDTYTPSDKTFTPTENTFTPPPAIEGNPYTPVENFTPVDTRFTPENSFPPVEGFPPPPPAGFQPNAFPPPIGNTFNPWMQQMPPPFPPSSFSPIAKMDNNFQDRNKNRQKRKKR